MKQKRQVKSVILETIKKQKMLSAGILTAVIGAVVAALIPPLIVQNFAENAIKHSLKIGNRITIFVIADYFREEGQPDKMRIRLADTGEGISDELIEKIELFKKTGEHQEGLGVGIQNTIERLKYLYADKSIVRIWRDEFYGGTNVDIILPIYFEGDSF